ncbi:hypothetical protein [Pseudomonas sp. UFMG81]|uniref:hypothetical protein n=1 Tax=Pseudomonas sp. UFMG81 TaxID=2745936 RepID=UPI00188FA700|nr:hypothetical protein [Pseudomonas sp. UFMG81]
MSNRLFYTPRVLDALPFAGAQPPADLSKPFRHKDNAAFLAEVAQQLQQLAGQLADGEHRHAADGEMAIGLIGSYGLFGYGLRRSQEIVRIDRGPSYWSHAFLFNGGLHGDARRLRGANSPWLVECTLRPSAQFSDALYRDGVMPRRLAEYAPATFDWQRLNSIPNFAVISLAMTDEERQYVRQAALSPESARQQLALSALAGQWFNYLSDKAEVRNPLTLGQPMHSAAYVQMAYAGANIDLAPSASQSTVCPEHFWGLAKYLQGYSLYYDSASQTMKPRPIRAWACIRDPHCLITGEAADRSLSSHTLADILGR